MQLAVIREIDCVGCGKCLPACPVDAIIGAPKFLHTVLESECIGCKLCVSPCPMDCIEMVEIPTPVSPEEKTLKANQAKLRFQARTKRLLKQEAPKLQDTSGLSHKTKIREEIAAAVERVKRNRVK